MFRDTHHGKPCAYCPRMMSSRDARLHPTRDHVHPRSKGAGQGIVVCCATCNGIKGDMLPDDWEAFMAAYPGWWRLSRLELRDIRRRAAGLPRVPRRVRGVHQVKFNGVRVVVPPELVFTRS